MVRAPCNSLVPVFPAIETNSAPNTTMSGITAGYQAIQSALSHKVYTLPGNACISGMS